MMFISIYCWKVSLTCCASDSEHYKECLDSVLKGPISITLRHRLQCHVIRDAARNEYETEEPILVLNEVTIDRGISSYLTNLECYCDRSFVTCVQGDGLILSTTSGSTAYSLAAGGSMVHPQVCTLVDWSISWYFYMDKSDHFLNATVTFTGSRHSIYPYMPAFFVFPTLDISRVCNNTYPSTLQ